MGFPSFRGEDLGVVAVEDGGGRAASGAVVAVGSFEVVEAQPRVQVGVDVVGVFVEAVAEGAAVVEMQAADISTASSISRIHRFAAGIVGDLLRVVVIGRSLLIHVARWREPRLIQPLRPASAPAPNRWC